MIELNGSILPNKSNQHFVQDFKLKHFWSFSIQEREDNFFPKSLFQATLYFKIFLPNIDMESISLYVKTIILFCPPTSL